MPLQVCMGAMMQCSFGMAPSSLEVLPTNRAMTNQVPDANIMDHIPIVNIMPFGMCMSPSNPATPAPWVAGAPTVLLRNFPSLDNVSQLMCIWGGVITFTDAGEATVE